jgi:hypothetical protein
MTDRFGALVREERYQPNQNIIDHSYRFAQRQREAENINSLRGIWDSREKAADLLT